ncbi:MAG TPA: hypothetical protein VH599_15760, partial [Ktedonobacterales bacterium]
MVLVAPPSRRPTLRQGERSPSRPPYQQASVQPPRGTRERPTGARLPRLDRATERSEGECGNWAARATNGSEDLSLDEAQPRQAAQAAGPVP